MSGAWSTGAGYATGTCWERVSYLWQTPRPSPTWMPTPAQSDWYASRHARPPSGAVTAVMYSYTAIFFWHNKLRGLSSHSPTRCSSPSSPSSLRRITDTFESL